MKVFSRARYRNPDSINETAQALAEILRRYRYFVSGMPKIEVARSISAHMDPDRNRPRSFRVFRAGIAEMLEAMQLPNP
jgi:hypothetical protein